MLRDKNKKLKSLKLLIIFLCITPLVIASISPLNTNQARAFSQDKNWPCIQRKVKTLTAGQMWRGAPLLPETKNAQPSQAVKDLVANILPRRIPLSETEKRINAFASAQQNNARHQLEQTFLTLLDEINQIRQEILSGINRYSKRQQALAERIKLNRAKRDKLDEKDQAGTLTKQEDKDLVKLEQTLEWDQRIHEEREQSLEYVCEAPVILEQRLFALAKQISKTIEKMK